MNYFALTIVNALDWEMNIQKWIVAPR